MKKIKGVKMFDFSADQLAVIKVSLSQAHYNYTIELDKIKKNKSKMMSDIGNHPERKKELKKLIAVINEIDDYLRRQ